MKGVDIMATKSIYKDVRIKDIDLCRKFVSALENSQNKSSKQVVISKRVTTVKGENLNEMFKSNK